MAKWLDEPEEHDYPAALSYLTLVLSQAAATATVKDLRKAPVTGFHAKDIFRASRLSLLGTSNSHVIKNLQKMRDGKKLSPLLLVRSHSRLIIADGYHRLCAMYRKDEDAIIPCKLVTARELTDR